MWMVWRSLAVGLLASAVAAPAALAEECVETLQRVPMMSPMAGRPTGPAAAPRRAPPAAAKAPRAAMARVTAGTARTRSHARPAKARKPAAAHVHRKAVGPSKRSLARRTAPAPRLAVASPPTTYPDGRLMMTRMALPPAEPQDMLIRTTTCTTDAPGGRLTPLLAPPGLLTPGGEDVPGEDIVTVPPALPPGPPFPEVGRPITEGPVPPPPGPPPGPPLGPPLEPPVGPPVVSPVPEPGTWATIILGLGMAGGLLRRRRRVTS